MIRYKTMRAQLVKHGRSNRLGLGLVFVTWFTFFSRTIFGQAVYFLDDLKIIYYPLEFTYAAFQNNWQLPIWSHEFGFGQPLIAWGQLGFFTPLHVILRLFQLHPITLLQVSIVVYFGLGAFGMFAFLRSLKLAQSGSALGAIIYTFSGFHIGHLNHVNFYTTTMWLPWLLLLINFFLLRPTILKSVLLALIGATMALSGQPQVVLYSFFMAALYGVITLISIVRQKIRAHDTRYLIRLPALSLIAVLLALSLSSFAILPLFEFLPLTDRAAGIPPHVLYEFSYPAWNTITLISPYFFGDHENYWGPKGFQELAAFTGIIPLLLAGVTILNWRQYRREKIFAWLLVIISIVFATGRFSPIYSYLVDHHIITSLSIPGRFVFFFTTGISILAAIGLSSNTNGLRQMRKMLAGLAFTLILLSPFIVELSRDKSVYNRLLSLITWTNPELYLIGLGLLLFISFQVGWPRRQITQPALLIIAALTILIYGWGFNPLTTPTIAYQKTSFNEELQAFRLAKGLPPRLYSRDELLQIFVKPESPRRLDAISKDLSVHQPIHISRPNLTCLGTNIWLPENASGLVTFTLTTDFSNPPIRQSTINTQAISTFDLDWCFDPIPDSQDKNYMISVTSDQATSLRLTAIPETNQARSVYIVRLPSPTIKQFYDSQKPLRVAFQPTYTSDIDTDAAILARHLNVVVHASSARWIGALSIGNYREFIERYFANDREPIDGEGNHAITANRKILNMSGVTHLSQTLDDPSDQTMEEHSYLRTLTTNIGHTNAVLYENRDAFPKAFLVPDAIFQPAPDEARHIMSRPDFDPRQTAILTGPVPPNLPLATSDTPFQSTAEITRYDPTQIEVNVTTSKESVLIVSDTTTPEWATTIDGQDAPHYVANTIFKAAIIPAGQHTVTFTYQSPAITKATQLTIFGLATTIILLVGHFISPKPANQ